MLMRTKFSLESVEDLQNPGDKAHFPADPKPTYKIIGLVAIGMASAFVLGLRLPFENSRPYALADLLSIYLVTFMISFVINVMLVFVPQSIVGMKVMKVL
ncbi:hypothetical protein AMTR_s00170p00039820 [Amborella trichopoda]|uniref:Uncharacterized protein n=1 Tax=Amborella trichopoda TaxID=13333 RepID=W1NRY0_AMBTC|nr:hypothetical protein AMTR_s00170p00039820 [Amborella trichopoda]